MFDNIGRPTGMGQNSPFTDTPNPSTAGPNGRPRSAPLQDAIGGSGAPQYPPDPGLVQWTQRAPNQTQPIGNTVHALSNPASTQTPVPTSLTPPSTPPSGRINDYIRQLIKSGMSPQAAAQQANQAYGRRTGNEAVYYGDTNTIGLPDTYLDGASGWGDVQRQFNSSSGNAQNQPNAASPLWAAISGGQNDRSNTLSYYLQLLQALQKV